MFNKAPVDSRKNWKVIIFQCVRWPLLKMPTIFYELMEANRIDFFKFYWLIKREEFFLNYNFLITFLTKQSHKLATHVISKAVQIFGTIWRMSVLKTIGSWSSERKQIVNVRENFGWNVWSTKQFLHWWSTTLSPCNTPYCRVWLSAKVF